MAVIIKRSHLGSGPPPRTISPQREQALLQRIESMPGFKALRNSLANAKEERAKEIQGQWESNAEVQQFRRQDRVTNAREAIERMIPTAKEVVSMRKGSEATHEEARSYAEGLAYKSDRDKE